MRIRSSNFLVTVISLATVAIFLVGCAGPFARPGREGPEDLPRKGKEPTISLYNKEKDQVEEMRLETYLQGVVAGEMENFWPTEALAAQAILARTFTLKKMEEGGVKEHNTDASTDEKEFQAYAADRINQRVKDAVEQTRGMVVTYDGKYINGWFHADAGGKTAASAVEGLDYRQEKAPYIKSVSDPGFEISPPENKSWKAEFPLSEVRQKIQNWTGHDPGAIDQVKILEKGPSGRATKIKLGNVTLSGPSLRLALGSEVMRSTLLSRLEVQGGRLIAEGRGFGHGVGMSQWGAKALAEQGQNAAEIVQYFFRDVRIQKAWD
ncbi:MAG TPA: SpoIID/LytB domain-containing protein [Clostridia bacterium]|nr:SpoIID/LytB domain-containing protein [Clostridia bacterium]